MHLEAHAALAQECGVGLQSQEPRPGIWRSPHRGCTCSHPQVQHTFIPRNGNMFQLGPGKPRKLHNVQSGYFVQDGKVLRRVSSRALKRRQVCSGPTRRMGLAQRQLDVCQLQQRYRLHDWHSPAPRMLCVAPPMRAHLMRSYACAACAGPRTVLRHPCVGRGLAASGRPRHQQRGSE